MSSPRYFRVSPLIWDEDYSEDARYLAFYLLTCEHRTGEGFYRLRRKYALADLEWSTERFGKALGELFEKGFCQYDADAEVMLVINAMKYQAPQNKNQAKNAIDRLVKLPPTPLTCMFKRLTEQFSEHLLKQLPEEFGEGYGNPQYPGSPVTQEVNQSPTDSPPPSGRALNQDEIIVQETIEKALGIVAEGKEDSLTDAYRTAFHKAWERAVLEERNPRNVGKLVLARYMAEMRSPAANGEYGTLQILVNEGGQRAFHAFNEAIIKAPDDWLRYARGVLKHPAGDVR